MNLARREKTGGRRSKAAKADDLSAESTLSPPRVKRASFRTRPGHSTDEIPEAVRAQEVPR